MTISVVLGSLVGFGFPVFFVSNEDKHDKKEAIDKIWFYTLVQTIVIVVLSIPIFILVKNMPKYSPSKSAEYARGEVSLSA